MGQHTEYLAENTLKQLDGGLHRRYTKCVARADALLVRYRSNFPEYTDHTLLHSVEVANLCNYLISDRIGKLNAAELYLLLMACLLHDVGMGLGEGELARYLPSLGVPELPAGPEEQADLIRRFHHDLGALFVLDRWRDCAIPDRETAAAVAEVGRGHRKVDLMDRERYPTSLRLPICKGPVNMPFLAAVLRLADEMDISASRNLMLQYAGFIPRSTRSAMEFQKHRSVRSELDGERFVLHAQTDDQQEYRELLALRDKLAETLDYCQGVALDSTGEPLPVRRVEDDIRFTGGEAPLRLEVEMDGEALTVNLTGRLDTLTAPVLEEKLTHQLGGHIRRLALDFEALDYISSAGLRVVLSAKKKMMSLEGELLVRGVSPDIMEIFHMTGFDTIIATEPLCQA